MGKHRVKRPFEFKSDSNRTEFHKKMEGLIHGIFCKLTGRIDWTIYGTGNIKVGKDCHIGKGVQFIATPVGSYDIYSKDFKNVQDPTIIIEDECFIGANAVILPGVHLGKHTIVGAGSIVTKSFPRGHCVIVGNPAKKLRELD